MDFYLLIKNTGKIIDKGLSKDFNLIRLKNLPQINLKLLQKEQFKKQQKQLVVLFMKRLRIKLKNSP